MIPWRALIPALLTAAAARATVTGRYVYFGNALSETMGLVEVEVVSGGENVIAGRPEVFTAGLDYGYWMIARTPEQKAEAARMLVDGDIDTTKRRVDFGSEIRGAYVDTVLRYTSFELDLGEEIPIDSIAIYRSRWEQKQGSDLGWRVLVVLDADRRIVSSRAWNVYGPDYRKTRGRWAFDMEPATGGAAGRVVPAGARAWLSEAEYLRDFLGKPVIDLVQEVTPELEARLAEFKKRDQPRTIRDLGRKFFQRVDLDRPELSEVRQLVLAEDYAAALDAFKAPFIANLEPLANWDGGEDHSIYISYSWTTEPDSRHACRARDLRNHIYADRDDLTVKRFVPGLLPPAKFTFPFQTRPLLLAYATTGNVEDLRLWEEMTDDWAIGFQDAADRDPAKLRDYFVLDPGIRRNFKDLYMAAQSNPDFVKDLSGATLARFLLPILEEVPVASWRVFRKCVFNHTFNCIPGGMFTSTLLDQFRAGERYRRELRQGLERLYTFGVTRDGSMVEIGDEGHFSAVTISPASMYEYFQRAECPPWFGPGLETYFLDNYRMQTLYGVRHIAPSGVQVRWNPKTDDLYYLNDWLGLSDPYWRNVVGARMKWGDSYPRLTRPILEEPACRALVDTVYGRGREPFTSRNRKRDQERLLEVYPGDYQGPPAVLSDWMPYAGLWYFRGGWDHEASFVHMIAPGAPNSNAGGFYPLTNRYGDGQFMTTSYRYHDYASPLLTCLSVLVDGQPPCPEEELAPSGSKQDVFTRAREKPLPERWYTDATLDFGEAEYAGNYREVGLRFDHKLRKTYAHVGEDHVDDVHTVRQLFQVRPARLFVQVDRLRFADGEPHTNTLTNTVILTAAEKHEDQRDPDYDATFAADQVQAFADPPRLETHNPENAGVTVRWFGQPDLAVEVSEKTLAHGSFGKYGGPTITMNGYRKTIGREVLTRWPATGESVLVSFLRAHRPGEQPLTAVEDLSTDTVAGARATTTEGVTVTFLVARTIPARLAAGSVSVDGEALLLVEAPDAPPTGFVLGDTGAAIQDYRIGAVPAPIRRPLDPPTIGPAVTTFTDTTTVTLTSASPDVDIHYLAGAAPEGQPAPLKGLADASVNATGWQRYTGPFTVAESTFVRARAFRRGVTEVPFTTAGTDVSAISYGWFHKRPLKPAVAAPTGLTPGLNYDYLEDRWFALWTYTDILSPARSGATTRLLDVSMRRTDGPFAVRYAGYIDIPRDGVYTFHGPREFIDNICAPGYDLRLFVDGEEWYLGQTWHGHGQWSVPLAKGLHEFRVTFADARCRGVEEQPPALWRHYPWTRTLWSGTAPVLEVSGPGVDRQPLPDAWLRHARPTHLIADFVAMTTPPESVVYKTVDDRELKLLVVRPENAAPGEQRPALVWIHGGGWRGGNPEMFIPHLRYSAARGAVGVSVQYRLVPKGTPPAPGSTVADCIADCADAIRYLRTHAAEFGIDPQRIVALGDSAGGHLALCLGTLDLGKDARVNAVIDCNGITDFVATKWRGLIAEGADQDARAAAVSPLRQLAAGAPPILVLHGGQDRVVPPAEAEAFHQACGKLGVDSEYICWPDATHAFVVTGYSATDTQITRAILAADAFLLARGLLDGPTSIHLPWSALEETR